MGEKTKDIKAIFWQAVEKENREEQLAYLEEACSDDAETRSKVEELLQAHEEAKGFLDIPPFVSDVILDASPLTEGPGTVIDKYKLLENIGEGGMAVVYMAEQGEPVHRKVALKIIKLGMDTKSVIARFEAERQALAMMEHPNIAKVLDAGATDTGRPYFVMELVTGISITEYCDKNNLGTKDRLALFVEVCKAIQHAHQKGIIHRDIKPSNVMVARRDGEPIPKVIDFGIAKATNQRLTEKTLFTRYGHIIGTPAYMSPEQAELSDLDVDTRTDVYSLGVLLYELLTGTTPFGEEELREAGFLQMQKIICESEPAKPSTKLSTLGETLTEIAKCRASTPDVLTKTIRGDLDWIVMKSLEKDRGHRYDTASALALDVQRHLHHEPVLARAPKVLYRFKKFFRRHQYQTIGGLAVAILVAAVIIVSLMWCRDRLQLAEAESYAHTGILKQARACLSERDLPAALTKVESILDSQYVGPEAQLLYGSILIEKQEPNEAKGILENLLDEEPKIASAAHALFARIYWEGSGGTERLTKVNEHLRKAEELLPETAEAYYLRALTAATIKETLGYLNKALDVSYDHYESRLMRASTYYCSRKFALAAEDALSLTWMSPKDSAGYVLRGNALRELGRFEEAVANFSKAIDLTTAGDAQLVDIYDRRRETYTQMGRYQEALLDAQKCASLSNGQEAHRVHVFTALVSLGRYEEAKDEFTKSFLSIPDSSTEFWARCGEYVVETLEAGRELTLPSAMEPAFIPMLEMKETYQALKSKGMRVVAHGFHANWSPDGTRLVYSMGVHGVSGVVEYDLESQRSELLAAPGKDPLYSPDGRHIAFIRDRQMLPLDRLATNREIDVQPLEQEEIWVMNSDGTEPRPLVRGKWPHWSPDSERLFYTTVPDNSIFSISVAQIDADPVTVLESPGGSLRVSSDCKYAAYLERRTLKIVDLSTKATLAEWKSPFPLKINSWAPNGPQMHTSSRSGSIGDSLWVYDLKRKDVFKIVDATRIGRASWSADGRKLALAMDRPFLDIWIIDAEMLEPRQTIEEHYQEQLALHTHRIEANPEDANSYFLRAQFHDYWGDRALAHADMRRWSAILGDRLSSDSPVRTTRDRWRVINLPFNCQLVFSAERHVNTISMMSVAFGQKGRFSMKLFKIPIVTTSLFGFCLLSALDALPTLGDFSFDAPTLVAPGCFDPSVTTDGLTLFSAALGSAHGSGVAIWVSTRETVQDDWGPPVDLGPTVNRLAVGDGGCPHISADSLTLYFDSVYPGLGGRDIWLTTRTTIDGPWSDPVNIGAPINSPYYDAEVTLSADGLSLYFGSNRPGGYGDRDIWFATRETVDSPWSEPRNLGPVVNSPAYDNSPSLSMDGRVLLFSSTRPGGFGNRDLWVTQRATTADTWTEPVNLGSVVNSPSRETAPCISADGSTVYFQSSGGVWQTKLHPIVDLNADGIVDAADICIVVDNWHTDNSLCDIAPAPMGDGFVDVQDLIVLAEHLFEEFPPVQ